MKYESYSTPNLDLVFDKCKPYIDMLKSCDDQRLLYRGVFEEDISIKEINHKWNRDPVDTPSHIHEVLNKEFKISFGWNARNGVFCYFKTARKHQLSGYGAETYMLFPIGEFEYLWSPKIYDLFGDYEMEMTGYYVPEDVIEDDWLEHLDGKKGTEEEYETFFNMRQEIYEEDFFEELKRIVKTYLSHGLCNCDQTREISIKCDKYFLISDEYFEQIQKRIWGIS